MLSRFTTLAVLVLAFALIACGGEEEPTTPDSPPVTDSPETAPETAPDDEPAPATGGTALSAFEKIKAAALAGDYSVLYDLLSADTRSMIDAQIAQAREMVKGLEGQAPMAADLVKGQVGDKYGFSYDDLMSKPVRDLGGKIISKAFGGKAPGVLTGEVVGEPKTDGDAATLSVKKANGAVKDVEMVKESDGWKLKYDL